MSKFQHYSLDDIVKIQKDTEKYSINNITSHLELLEHRKLVLNQICSDDFKDQMILERVNSIFDELRGNVIKNTNSPTYESTSDYVNKISLLHKDMLELEGKYNNQNYSISNKVVENDE